MGLRKLDFRLVQDEDGYPPFTVESVWVNETDVAGQYRINNIPFFTRDATLDDIVRAIETNGRLEFAETLVCSPRSLIRVIFFAPERTTEVRDHLVTLGCSSEWFKSRKLIAVDVPISVDLRIVQRYLATLAEAGAIDREEPILRHPELPD